MTSPIVDFSEIDLTGSVRFEDQQIGSVHYNGERLWPFGVDLLYTGGIGGASYLPDPADVFSDNVGSSGATFGGSVGLVLDEKNGVPALGPELVTNGDFSNGTAGWISTSGGSIANISGVGVVTTFNGDSAGGALNSVSVISGKWYQISWDVKAFSQTGWAVQIGTSALLNAYYDSGVLVTLGTFSRYVLATDSTINIRIYARSDGVGDQTATFDNISVRELPAVPARQPSASLRPLLGRAPKDRRNLLERTEELHLSPWSSEIAPDTTVTQGSGDGFTTIAFTAPSTNRRHARRQLTSAISLGDVAYLRARFRPGDGTTRLALGTISSAGRFGWATYDILTSTWQNVIVSTPGSYDGIAAHEIQPGVWELIVKFTADGVAAPSAISITFGSGPASNLVANSPVASCDIGFVQLSHANQPYQRVGAATDVTEAGAPSYPFVRFDLSDDRLDTVLPQAVTGDVVIAGRNGSVIAPHSYAANTTFQLGPTSYTGGTPGILRAIGDVVGWSVLNKTLTAAERERLMRFYKRRGAKGLLVPGGPELVVNGTFDSNLNGWSNNGSATWSSGGAAINQAGSTIVLSQFAAIVPGKAYEFRCDCTTYTSGSLSFSTATGAIVGAFIMTAIGSFRGVVVAGTANNGIRFGTSGTGFIGSIDNVSVRELRPEEEW